MKKILAIFLSTLFCLWQIPAYAEADVSVIQQHKGLQRNPKADKIEDGAHDIFTNVYIDDANIVSVKGRDRLNNTANADPVVNMLCYYENAAATTKKWVVKETDEVVTYDVDGTNRTQIAASLTNEKADCTQVGNTFYFNSSTDGLYKWTGTGSASAVGSVSAPSSVDFSAVSGEGGLTSGLDIIPAEKGITVSVNTSESINFHSSLSTCYNPGATTDFSAVAGTSISASDITSATTSYLVSPETLSTYFYKVTQYSTKLGLESEASASDTATLTGASTFDVSCTDVFVKYFDTTCTSGSSTQCENQEFLVNEDTRRTRTTGTLAAAPTAPFDEYCVYRTVAGGSEYFRVGCQDTGTFTDGKPDVSLDVTLDTTIDTITPPSFRYIEEYKGTLFTAEDDEIRFTRTTVDATNIANLDTYWLNTDQLTISSENGFITGLQKTADSLIIFTGKTIQEITGFGVDSFRLRNLNKGIGAINDETIEVDTQGDIIFFAGVQGVYKLRTFQQPQDELTGAGIEAPRVTIQKLSGPVLDDVFLGKDSEIVLDPADYAASNAYYDVDNDLYFLYIGNDCLMFDNASGNWSYIPGVKVIASAYKRSSNEVGQSLIIDNLGYMYQNWYTYANGVESGTVVGKPTSSTSNTLTDTSASFDITNDGLAGSWVFIDNESNNGNGEYHQITANTATQITIADTWTVNPITADDYYIGYIVTNWRTKQYQFDPAPRESNVMSFWVINELADSTQDLEFYTYENKSSTPSRQVNSIIDLSQKYINKIGSKLRSSWVQWEFRSFVYNISDAISRPVDITSYAIEYEREEER